VSSVEIGGAPPRGSAGLSVYDAMSANRWRTTLLLTLFMALVAGLAYVFGEIYSAGAGLVAVPIALAIGSVMAFATYFGGDRVVLSVSHARELPEAEAPELHHIVEELAIGSGIPKPRVYVVEDPSPNAFATGRDPQHSSIAVTSGLLQRLDRTELEGVIAHELSHVRNRDTRVLLIAAVLLGSASLISDLLIRGQLFGLGQRSRNRSGSGVILILIGLVLAIMAPILAQLIRLGVSRQREYLADASGALLTRYPEGLANALRKITTDPRPSVSANRATAPLCIVDPFHAVPRRLASLFDTHPPTADRIRRLEAM